MPKQKSVYINTHLARSPAAGRAVDTARPAGRSRRAAARSPSPARPSSAGSSLVLARARAPPRDIDQRTAPRGASRYLAPPADDVQAQGCCSGSRQQQQPDILQCAAANRTFVVFQFVGTRTCGTRAPGLCYSTACDDPRDIVRACVSVCLRSVASTEKRDTTALH